MVHHTPSSETMECLVTSFAKDHNMKRECPSFPSCWISLLTWQNAKDPQNKALSSKASQTESSSSAASISELPCTRSLKDKMCCVSCLSLPSVLLFLYRFSPIKSILEYGRCGEVEKRQQHSKIYLWIHALLLLLLLSSLLPACPAEKELWLLCQTIWSLLLFGAKAAGEIRVDKIRRRVE
jgi:hypothetical protein